MNVLTLIGWVAGGLAVYFALRGIVVWSMKIDAKSGLHPPP
jgi:hypothetical protein